MSSMADLLSQALKDAILRRMHLSRKKDGRLLQIVQTLLEDKDNSSSDTLQFMASVLLVRLVLGAAMHQHHQQVTFLRHVANDLVECRTRIIAAEASREWSVPEVGAFLMGKWTLQAASVLAGHLHRLSATDLFSNVRERVQELLQQCEVWTCAWQDFWFLHDSMGTKLLGDRTTWAWSLACLWVKQQNTEADSSRNHYMLACAASLYLMTALEEIKQANHRAVGNKRRRLEKSSTIVQGEKEQSLEEPKGEMLLNNLVRLANAQASYTRGTSTRAWKESLNLTVEQVSTEVQALVAHVVKSMRHLNGFASSLVSEKDCGDSSTSTIQWNVMERIRGLLEVDIDTFVNLLPQAIESMREGEDRALSYVNEMELIGYSSLEGFVTLPSSTNPKNLVSETEYGQEHANNAEKDLSRLIVHSPLITETVELSEWAFALLNLEVVKPSKQLLRFLECRTTTTADWRDTVFPILNDALPRLLRALTTNGHNSQVIVEIEPDLGQVTVAGPLTESKRLCRAVVAFFYHVLESMLCLEEKDLGGISATTGHDEHFQKSLLACCCACVLSAADVKLKVPSPAELWHAQVLHAILVTVDSNPFDFLKVTNDFVRCLTDESTQCDLGSPLVPGLPRILQKRLEGLVSSALECVLWSQEFPQFIDAINQMKESLKWPPSSLTSFVFSNKGITKSDFSTYEDAVGIGGVDRLVNCVLQTILKNTYSRLEAICNFLNVPSHFPIVKEMWGAFLHLLRNNCEEMRGRHLDHWLLCSIYGVSRSLRYVPELKFTTIIDAYIAIRDAELGESTCQQIVRNVKLNDEASSTGDIIALYNRRFVPLLKDHLLSAKMTTNNSIETRNINKATNIPDT